MHATPLPVLPVGSPSGRDAVDAGQLQHGVERDGRFEIEKSKVQESEEEHCPDGWKLRGAEQWGRAGDHSSKVSEEKEEEKKEKGRRTEDAEGQKGRRTEDEEGRRQEVFGEKGRRTIRRLQAEGVRDKKRNHVSQFVASMEYEVKRGDVWHRCHGFVPVRGDEEIRIQVKPSKRCWMENTFAILTNRRTLPRRTEREWHML